MRTEVKPKKESVQLDGLNEDLLKNLKSNPCVLQRLLSALWRTSGSAEWVFHSSLAENSRLLQQKMRLKDENEPKRYSCRPENQNNALKDTEAMQRTQGSCRVESQLSNTSHLFTDCFVG